MTRMQQVSTEPINVTLKQAWWLKDLSDERITEEILEKFWTRASFTLRIQMYKFRKYAKSKNCFP